MNAQKNAQRAAMRAHFRRKYQLSEVRDILPASLITLITCFSELWRLDVDVSQCFFSDCVSKCNLTATA